MREKAVLRVSVFAEVAGQPLAASTQVEELVEDGFTDLGIIVPEPVIFDAFSREFSVYNDAFDPLSDAFSREFSVYNNVFMDMMDDAVSREFSVYNDAFDPLNDAISREFSVLNDIRPP